MKLWKYFALGALALPLLGCGPGASNQDGGTVVGAVAGGIIGNQFGHGAGRALATVGGAVVGGIIGNQIGKDLDERDRQMASDAEYASLEYEEERRWRNEENGHYGYIKPRRSYRYSGMKCREYEQTVYIKGRPETMVGKACKQPDGTWKAVS
jgi:surface antigen